MCETVCLLMETKTQAIVRNFTDGCRGETVFVLFPLHVASKCDFGHRKATSLTGHNMNPIRSDSP